MAEEKVEQAPTELTKPKFDPSKIASAGPAQRGDFANTQQKPTETSPAPAATAAAPAADTKPADTTAAPAAITVPDLSDEQLREILKGKGINFEGDFEAMKNKLGVPADTTPAQSPEQIAAQEKAFDKRLLDFHIENGGTAEQFVALKQIASMDLKELSPAAIRKELGENGFTADEIDLVIKERYYQLNPDELVKDDDEEDEVFNKKKELLKKKVSYGSKLLESRASDIKKDAEETLNSLRQSVLDKDAKAKQESEYSSKVEEYSKKLPRTLTVELGEINNEKVEPVTITVSESDIQDVTATFKDKAKRESIFYNQDGTLNHTKLMEVELRNKTLEAAVKASYIEGGNRQVEAFRKVFPDSPYALGVGGTPQANKQGQKGKIVSAGKPELVRRNN